MPITGAPASWIALGVSPEPLRKLLRLIWRPTNGPAALVMVVIFALFCGLPEPRVHEQRMRADILANISVIRAKLEGNVNGNMQLVRGLIATMTTEPDMNQQRFAQLAHNLFPRNRSCATSPARPIWSVKLIYPMEGNEKAHRPRLPHATTRSATRRCGRATPASWCWPARSTCVQGGRGFIGRFPVFIAGRHGTPTFWGIVSAVIDVDGSTATAACSTHARPSISPLPARTRTGAAGAQFFGDADDARRTTR